MYEQVSYWVLLWALLFTLGLVSLNPLFPLLFIYLITSTAFFYIYFKGAKPYYLLKFIIINLMLKFMFIIIIAANYPIIFNMNDFYFLFVIVFLYIILMASLNKNPFYYYYYHLDLLINGLNEKNRKYYLYIDKYYDDFYNLRDIGSTRLQ